MIAEQEIGGKLLPEEVLDQPSSHFLDPEELSELMQAYRKACSDVIARYYGHVAQYLGDGVMVYWAGRPRTRTTPAARSAPISWE